MCQMTEPTFADKSLFKELRGLKIEKNPPIDMVDKEDI